MLQVDPSMVVHACMYQISRSSFSDSCTILFLSIDAFLVHALYLFTHRCCVALIHYSCATLIHHSCFPFLRCAHSSFMRRICITLIHASRSFIVHASQSFTIHISHSSIIHVSHPCVALIHRSCVYAYSSLMCHIHSPTMRRTYFLPLDMHQVSDHLARVLRYDQDEFTSRCTYSLLLTHTVALSFSSHSLNAYIYQSIFPTLCSIPLLLVLV